MTRNSPSPVWARNQRIRLGGDSCPAPSAIPARTRPCQASDGHSPVVAAARGAGGVAFAAVCHGDALRISAATTIDRATAVRISHCGTSSKDSTADAVPRGSELLSRGPPMRHELLF